MPTVGSYVVPVVGATSAIRPDSRHGQRSASVAGPDSVVWRQEGVVKEGCGGEEQKDEPVGGTPSKDILRVDGVSSFLERTQHYFLSQSGS